MVSDDYLTSDTTHTLSAIRRSSMPRISTAGVKGRTILKPHVRCGHRWRKVERLVTTGTKIDMSCTIQMGTNILILEFRQLTYSIILTGQYVQEASEYRKWRGDNSGIYAYSISLGSDEIFPRCGLVQLLCCTVVCWTENAFKGLTFW